MNTTPNYIIGIGAAAGGFEVLQELFNCMPKTNELAFIIVWNVSPDFNIVMSELLAQNTAMPIETAKHNMRLQKGVIYLTPATYTAQIVDNCFVLNKINNTTVPMPINTLFESLASHYKHLAIGIILSGSGVDGSLGLTSIAKHNGLTIAQTPTEAKFTDMPNNAIATKQVNYTLSVSEIPNILLEYTTHPDDFNKQIKQFAPPNELDYQDIFHLLNMQYHANFSVYKIGMISRRVQRRMQLLGIERVADYVIYLRQNSEGLKTLYQYLLIGVTEFFRDEEAFAKLETEIIPELFKRAQRDNTELRIWIPACATGEEAYSVAILCKKYADKHHFARSIKIFASDVFPYFIQKAKKGRYSSQEISKIPPNYLNKYFIKHADYYEIIPEIRSQILFTTHNLLKDPPFTKLDLICCRNFLIYIKSPEQRRVVDLLRFSLNVGGVLFLGPSEGLASLKHDLITHNQTWKLFKKVKPSELPQITASQLQKPFTREMLTAPPAPHLTGSLPLFAYNTILQEVVSAGFIIDTAYIIHHSIGKARNLLMLPEGIPSLVLPKIIIDDLKALLIAALYQVKIKLAPVVYEPIALSTPYDKAQNIKMSVYPICDQNNSIAYYWIRLDPLKIKKPIPSFSSSQKNTLHEELIIALEGELVETKTMLQSALENMETFNEEMQSTNEELMAANEELQAIIEERQSTNEELNRVNLECTKKIDDAMLAKEDMENLIRSAEICSILLNSKLEICVFTPAIKKIFNLMGHDIGRPLKDFHHNLKDDQIIVNAAKVLHSKEIYENQIMSHDHRWYLLKIAPHSPPHSQDVTGVVISFTEITKTK